MIASTSVLHGLMVTVLSLADRWKKKSLFGTDLGVRNVHFNTSLKQKESFDTDLVYVATVKKKKFFPLVKIEVQM